MGRSKIAKNITMKTAKEFLKQSSLNGYIAGDYTPLEVYELMEDYAEYYHEQKLLQHSVMQAEGSDVSESELLN